MLNFFKKDHLVFGLILGLVLPVPVSFLLIGLLTLLQQVAGILAETTYLQMTLLSMAFNLLLMRFYFVKLKFENTGRGLMLITLAMVVVYLVFFARPTVV